MFTLDLTKLRPGPRSKFLWSLLDDNFTLVKFYIRDNGKYSRIGGIKGKSKNTKLFLRQGTCNGPLDGFGIDIDRIWTLFCSLKLIRDDEIRLWEDTERELKQGKTRVINLGDREKSYDPKLCTPSRGITNDSSTCHCIVLIQIISHIPLTQSIMVSQIGDPVGQQFFGLLKMVRSPGSSNEPNEPVSALNGTILGLFADFSEQYYEYGTNQGDPFLTFQRLMTRLDNRYVQGRELRRKFSIEEKQTFKCSLCGHTYSRTETLVGVTVPIKVRDAPRSRGQKSISVADLLKHEFCSETITGWKCKSTHGCTGEESTKTHFITSKPAYLIINIRRAVISEETNKTTRSKNSIRINHDILLPNAGGSPNQKRYGISAVIEHHGSSANSGHYVCYVKSSLDPRLMWMHCDDKVVEMGWAPNMLSNVNCSVVVYSRLAELPAISPLDVPAHTEPQGTQSSTRSVANVPSSTTDHRSSSPSPTNRRPSIGEAKGTNVPSSMARNSSRASPPNTRARASISDANRSNETTSDRTTPPPPRTNRTSNMQSEINRPTSLLGTIQEPDTQTIQGGASERKEESTTQTVPITAQPVSSETTQGSSSPTRADSTAGRPSSTSRTRDVEDEGRTARAVDEKSNQPLTHTQAGRTDGSPQPPLSSSPHPSAPDQKEQINTPFRSTEDISHVPDGKEPNTETSPNSALQSDAEFDLKSLPDEIIAYLPNFGPIVIYPPGRRVKRDGWTYVVYRQTSSPEDSERDDAKDPRFLIYYSTKIKWDTLIQLHQSTVTRVRFANSSRIEPSSFRWHNGQFQAYYRQRYFPVPESYVSIVGGTQLLKKLKSAANGRHIKVGSGAAMNWDIFTSPRKKRKTEGRQWKQLLLSQDAGQRCINNSFVNALQMTCQLRGINLPYTDVVGSGRTTWNYLKDMLRHVNSTKGRSVSAAWLKNGNGKKIIANAHQYLFVQENKGASIRAFVAVPINRFDGSSR